MADALLEAWEQHLRTALENWLPSEPNTKQPDDDSLRRLILPLTLPPSQETRGGDTD